MSGFGNATLMFIMLYSPISIAAIHRIERNRLQQLIRSGRLPSFCQFLKGRAVTFEDAGSHDINGFLFRQFQIWILFQIDQTVFGPAVLKNDDCSCLVRKLATLEKFWFASVMDTMLWLSMFISAPSILLVLLLSIYAVDRAIKSCLN